MQRYLTIHSLTIVQKLSKGYLLMVKNLNKVVLIQ